MKRIKLFLKSIRVSLYYRERIHQKNAKNYRHQNVIHINFINKNERSGCKQTHQMLVI